jgi:ubiquinone/menaquinone biosynthesis C-methylase UbiE
MNSTHTCPWWLAPTFDNPLRRWIQPADKILAGLVGPGQSALDVGCGMGYFTIALARLVGPEGHVIAADLQEQMLDATRRRLERYHLLERVQLLRSTPEQIGAPGLLDFALAFWMVHEVGDQAGFLSQTCALLRPGGRFLLVEPRLHVTGAAFEKTIKLAVTAGLRPVGNRAVRLSRAVIFQRS